MSPDLVIGTGLVLGGILAALAWARWREVVRCAERRNLASALTGEIVAVLRAIESESFDHVAAPVDGAAALMPHLFLPHFSVYAANAGKLDRFAAPLPRKIAFFFSRLTTLAEEFRSCETTSLPAGSGHARHLQDDLAATLDLADEILLALRSLVSPHSQAKHLTQRSHAAHVVSPG